MHLRTFLSAAVLTVSAILTAAPAAAQQQPPAPAQRPALPDPANISAAEIQRWFEAYTVLRAQEALELSEAQYGRFVSRLKSLQETRRRQQQARNRLLADIRRILNPQTGSQDEAQLTDLMRALRELDDRGAADVKRAYDAVDEALDVRQRARFRLFEDRMEQQKLELLMRARQNARARRGSGGR
jgi:hypothetical protein